LRALGLIFGVIGILGLLLLVVLFVREFGFPDLLFVVRALLFGF
jgi:hypothetical protein